MSLTCKGCGAVEFPSRNKLFAHLKICLVNRNPTNFIRTPDTDFFREHDAYLYVCGGRIRGKTLGFVERYNYATNTWEKMEGLKENRGSHVSAAMDNFVYVIGGGGFRSNLDSIERIDVLSNERTTLAPLPCSRHALAAVTVDRSIYTIGGWIGGSISSTDLERYDIESNTWTVLASMPTGRRLLAACYHNQLIYTFGGNLRDEDKWNSDAMEIYDIPSNSWSKGPNVPIAGQCSAVTILDYIYVIVHGHCIYRYDPSSAQYVQVCRALPLEQWFSFDVAVLNEYMYIVGGNVQGVWSNVFFKYDVFTNTWEQLNCMSKCRRRCSASVVVVRKEAV